MVRPIAREANVRYTRLAGMSATASSDYAAPADGRRVAWTIVALAFNIAVVVLSLSEPLGDVLIIAATGALPAVLFALRDNLRPFRAVAVLIAGFYVALPALIPFVFGYVPAALCLLAAGLPRRGSA